MKHSIQLGVSLYSLSPLYVTGRWSLEDCLKAVSDMGYTGIEIVAAQMVPEYPNPSDRWLGEFRSLVAKYNLDLVNWSAYIDMGIRSDRDLTKEEIIQYTHNDMIYAKKAGADMVRTQHAITPAIYKSMLPLCKKLDMKLVIEMHSPHHPRVPVWQEYLAIMSDPASEGYFGAVPDFSIFQYAPHKIAKDDWIASGCRPEVMAAIERGHLAGKTAEENIAAGKDYTAYEKNVARDVEHRFCAPASLDELPALLKVSPYIHGKFHYLPENCSDPTIPYEKILPIVAESGFSGYLACEYEGHAFDVDPREQLKRFSNMFHRILD